MDSAGLQFHQPDFNPRTSCEVRLNTVIAFVAICHISIHAPLARCDSKTSVKKYEAMISIHAPLARCDLIQFRF